MCSKVPKTLLNGITFFHRQLCLYSHEYLLTRVTLPFFYLCSSSWFSGFPCLLHSLYFVLSFRVLLDLDFVLRNKIGNHWIWFQEKTNQPLCNREGGLKLLRRRRLRKRDFPNTKKRGREPTSFWWENKVAAVSLLRVLARKTSYQMLEILPFSDREKTLPPSTEINVLTFVVKKLVQYMYSFLACLFLENRRENLKLNVVFESKVL